MATGDPGGNGPDPTRGSGAGKETEAAPTSFEAAPGEFSQEPGGGATPDPARGGCLKLGWGCLPVLVGLVLALPAGLFF